ncbi:TetR/AcrR family transcriptional regulator [Pseudoruegeria sp. HB172150]|uniref:TetR/AcrR family transcriptional regulator n=1 Tax=Pseudoruegeria sp. HB172150 TaxID=2721164 RepID=UPI0015559BA7
MSPAASAKARERVERVVAAAEALFVANGLRGTTMEAIAKAAGVAKPTLYSYYPDKEAVFAAVIAAVVERMKAVADVEFNGDGPPDTRIARGLTAKYEAVRELLQGSPHALELMGSKHHHAKAEFADLNRWLVERLSGILVAAGWNDGIATERARLLIACGEGIHDRAMDMEELSRQMDFVTRRLLAET